MPPRLRCRFPGSIGLEIEGRLAGVDDKAHGPIRLTPALCGAKPVDADVVVEDATAGVVGDRAPVSGRPRPVAPTAQRVVAVRCFQQSV